ncbi:DUF1501 domain-containing protein [Lignipirellula cremea]|uniref:Sulfatase n=1 Tax=Lignipirellula cremea TaxID=2528010 RepID=A0A518DKF7_9BACT|nr:DUF1501 domain-containing protein [Lignipirellula cremea]QDU92318.1 hypothetical protein Pla8534_00630 [Lignipirellula cremea]
MQQHLSRRQALQGSAAGFGYLAFSALQQQTQAANGTKPAPHFAPKVKRVIFMFMEGGPSHVDSFDYKPALARYTGKKPPYDQPKAGGTGHNDSVMQESPFAFSQHGESGLWISEIFPELAKHADDLCLINSMHHETGIHTPGCVIMHTGDSRFTRPSMGSWITYGLGAETQELPGYMVVNPRDRNIPAGCYSNAFLPARHHSTIMQNVGLDPDLSKAIRNVTNQHMTDHRQRQQLDFIQQMNGLYRQKQDDSQVDAVIESYEQAYRMQSAVPRLFDFKDESQSTLDLYGIGKKAPPFAVQCLLARRMAEAGVRFIEISQGGWDSHNDLQRNLAGAARNVDAPIAALITDLKQRGMWQDTLLVWGGEFGRTPAIEDMKDKSFGRDHNGAGFTYWIAGGGVQGGIRYGATDELGWFAAENKVHARDLHATILHLLGLDHRKLSFRYGGRDYTPTDVDGEVVKGILA